MILFNCCADEEVQRERRQHRQAEHVLAKSKKSYNETNRLLLLGAGESGKSTFVRQMVILHVQGGFTEEERLEKALQIRNNVKDTIETILEAMRTMDPPVKLGDPANEEHLKYVEEQSLRTDFEFTPEYFERVEILWKDPGVQAAYGRSNEYQLIDCAPYFMAVDKMIEVARPDYKPSNQDILHCRVRTTNIQETKFTWDSVKFHIFDVGGQRGERRKWIHCFNDVTAIIFLVASSSYNLVLQEDADKNRLEEALELFEQVWRNRWLKHTSVILFLNKQDLLEKKISEGCFKLETYFPNFSAYQLPSSVCESRGGESSKAYLRAKYFIRSLFVNICQFTPYEDKKLFTYFTTAVDTNNIQRVFTACKRIIIEEHLRFVVLV